MPGTLESFFGLRGKTVLVTGANRGIGLALARAIGLAGARVVIWGRSPERNAEAQGELAALGIDVLAQDIDVTDEAAVEQAFADAVRRAGDIHGVVANAGVASQPVPLHKVETAEYMRVLGTNQLGVMYTLRAATRHMQARAASGGPGGSLVGIASTAAVQGYANRSPYASAKGAMVALMRTIAAEYGHLAIRANTVVLGVIDTDIIPEAHRGPITAKLAERAMIPRLGKPDEVAALAIYLLGDGSAFHTGDTLVLDGGTTARGL